MQRRVFCVFLTSMLFSSAFALLTFKGIELLPPAILGAWGGLLGMLFWVVLVERFLLPVWEGMRDAERKYRLRRGLCLKCGYDLRASGDRCPECGTTPTDVRTSPE